MADSFQLFTGAGSFSFTKPFLRTSDVKVEVNGTLKSSGVTVTPVGSYPYSQATVELSPNTSSGDKVKIYRDTDVSGVMYKDFADGSVLKALDLDDIQRYLLFVSQEKAESTKDYEGALPMGGIRQIVSSTQQDDAEMATSTSTGNYIKSSCQIVATPKAWSSTWLIMGTIQARVHSPTGGTSNSGITLKMFKDSTVAVGQNIDGTALGPVYRMTDRNSEDNENTYILFPVCITMTTSNRTQFSLHAAGKLIVDAGENFLVHGATDRSLLHAVEIA
tara:strand:+ start:12743 stop:13570 length:828 start_codon:yes stop_codon:yes gene_type:complete